MSRIVVVGGGVGGLAAAAVLSRAGLDVTVLEAHVYPGGCAGTFYHQGYRFDAGATLAGGFYAGGPMDLVAQAAGIEAWPARSADPAMAVHLPDGTVVVRRSGPLDLIEQCDLFGPGADAFWGWQQRTADVLWDFALRLPAWPPQSPLELARLFRDGAGWAGAHLPSLRPEFILDAFRPVAAHLRQASDRLRLFIDAQLLISAQTTSTYANALYGASALDLPRRGVVHLQSGMGAIAHTLADAVRRGGGAIHYRQEVTRVAMEKGRPAAVETKRGDSFSADVVIFNLPPWNVARLLGDDGPRRLRALPQRQRDGWGAFVVYVGLDGSRVSGDAPLHHQVIIRETIAEGNTIFLSINPKWDGDRAPAGRRALTISTHTDLKVWWDLFERDRAAYDARVREYTNRVLAVAEIVLPGLRDAAELILPGTPVTFQRFTRRIGGWVGGFPQTSLFRVWGPRLAPEMWLVGDSIFPGQSTAAVAMGGLRVARALLRELGIGLERPSTELRKPIADRSLAQATG